MALDAPSSSTIAVDQVVALVVAGDIRAGRAGGLGTGRDGSGRPGRAASPARSWALKAMPVAAQISGSAAVAQAVAGDVPRPAATMPAGRRHEAPSGPVGGQGPPHSPHGSGFRTTRPSGSFRMAFP
jgi:hypothetical protein